MSRVKPKIVVAIYLRGSRLDPKRVSGEIGVEPSRAQKRGNRSFSSAQSIAKIGVWARIAQTDSDSLSDHLSELFSIMANVKKSLKTLANVEEAYLDIFIATSAGQNSLQSVAFSLSLAEIELIRALGLALRCTLA